MRFSPKWFSLIVAVLVFWSRSVEAHDIYSHLLDETGRSCCNDMDCQPVLYRLTATGVQMFIAERWIHIPQEKIQYRSLPGDNGTTGGGHWCGSELIELNGVGKVVYITRCAIIPPQSTSVSFR